jgi:hypothetical protein
MVDEKREKQMRRGIEAFYIAAGRVDSVRSGLASGVARRRLKRFGRISDGITLNVAVDSIPLHPSVGGWRRD